MDAGRPSYGVKTHQLLTLTALLVGKNAIFKLPYLLFAYGAGMGYTMTFYFTLGMVVFCTECSYSTVFLVNWFQNPLPWADCDQDWMPDKESCYVQTSDMTFMVEVTAPVYESRNSAKLTLIYKYARPKLAFGGLATSRDYAICSAQPGCELSVDRTRVLRISTETGDASSVHPEMTVTTAVLWLITYGLTRNGVHKNKHIIYAIVAFSTLSLILLVGVALTLEGSKLGLLLLLRSRTSSFYDYKLWRDALKMCVGHIGILGSAFLNVVRFNTFKNNLKL
ncbi:creatine transporter-like [Ixodes scapularis]|uniref:creatine transporter-like n=1 Tax=Ixodes scapularis TaxID=6945 RepID=UPI001A9D39AB|nr:creatine transporter-like [Ixodes scapularis]